MSPVVMAKEEFSSSSFYKVGFWLSEKKWNKLNVEELHHLLSERGCQLVRLNPDVSLDQQGPFAAIVHKASDEVAKAITGDVKSRKRIQSFESFVSNHPEMVLIDSLESVRVLMQRNSEYHLVSESYLVEKGLVYAPAYVELTSTDVSENSAKVKEAGVHFPVVCKPLMAHGSAQAHQMSLVFCEKGLKDIQPPCVAQSFINHNARLFKMFVIRDKYYVVERPSLKNFLSGDFPSIHFDAHSISKPDATSSLTELDADDDVEDTTPSPEILQAIFEDFKQRLKLTLFGIDIIVEKGSRRHAIIDMNVFPGYDGVANFFQDFADMIVDEIEKRKLLVHQNELAIKDNPIDKTKSLLLPDAITPDVSKDKCIQKTIVHAMNGNDIDSGIDTSDSCDEKKKNQRKELEKKIKTTRSGV